MNFEYVHAFAHLLTFMLIVFMIKRIIDLENIMDIQNQTSEATAVALRNLAEIARCHQDRLNKLDKKD